MAVTSMQLQSRRAVNMLCQMMANRSGSPAAMMLMLVLSCPAQSRAPRSALKSLSSFHHLCPAKGPPATGCSRYLVKAFSSCAGRQAESACVLQKQAAAM